MPRILPLLLCLVLTMPAGADPVADEALALARMGAADLALATLDRQVPDRLAHPERWVARERARLEILGMEGRWQAVVNRAARLPGGLPMDFVVWVRSREAHALLALERPTEARALLRDLIWFSGDAVPASWHDAWRRMLAEAYRMEGLPADALSTLRRLRQDRGAEADIPLPLEARILMDQDRHDEAAGLLEGTESPEGTALRWLALLQAGQVPPEQVRQSMREAAAAGNGVSDGDRARYLAVAAEAALRMADPVVRADTLEAAFGLQHLVREDGGFGLPADALWEAWLVLGETAGNERQLLIGDDDAWLAAAAEVEPESAVTGRALLTVVALRSRDEALRVHAHGLLAGHVLTLPDGDRVLETLYLDGPRFGAPERVPVTVRNLLAEQAMGRGELDTASALMAGVALPPEGANPFEWGLRRARLLILGGQEEAGIDGLYEVLSGVGSLEPDAADRFLQVLFDLQSVRRHDAAIHLFRAVSPRLEDPRQVREVLYWEADSHRALGEYEQAARLYLRSAAMGNGPSDPWGMTARFQAAQALADAGLVADARTLYAELLRITRDQERRVVLRQRLQELDLR